MIKLALYLAMLIPVACNAMAPARPTAKPLTRSECRKLKKQYSTDTMKVIIPACVALGFDKYETSKGAK